MLKSIVKKLLSWIKREFDLTPKALETSLRSKLTRSDVERLIDNNGGPEGLDLSGYDLTGINLSKLDLHGVLFGSTQILEFAGSEDILTKGAILDGAWLERCNLQRANFGRTSLKGAHFYHSDLTESTLWAANAEGSDFRKANLTKVDFYTAILNNCRLMDSKLNYANLHRTSLLGATFSANSINGQLLQENLKEYQQYFTRWYMNYHVKELYQERSLKGRFKEAEEVYLVLKNAFLNSGRYEDASWAYVKERQMERKTYFPITVRQYYENELPSKYSFKSLRWWLFHTKYTFKWLFAWIVELFFGYGERPFRVAIWSFAAIIIFAITYHQLGGIATASGHLLKWTDYFQYSLATFSTINFAELQPTNDITKLLSSIEALIGISALAMLMFSLGNRINRS